MSDSATFSVLERRTFLLWSVLILAIVGLPFFGFLGLKASGMVLDGCDIGPCTTASYVGLNWLAILSCASLFGAVGVMMSLVLRRKLDAELSKLGAVQALLVVYGTGVIFAILMLAMFIGGLLKGALFPRFEFTSWSELLFRIEDWGKLIVWAFVAGFSERLMPDFFDQLVSKAGSSKRES